MSSHSSHQVLLKGGLKPHSFHFIFTPNLSQLCVLCVSHPLPSWSSTPASINKPSYICQQLMRRQDLQRHRMLTPSQMMLSDSSSLMQLLLGPLLVLLCPCCCNFQLNRILLNSRFVSGQGTIGYILDVIQITIWIQVSDYDH